MDGVAKHREAGNSSYTPLFVPSFTPDQYHYIMKILNKDSAPQDNTVNMAGTTQDSKTNFNIKCLFVGSETSQWVVDTGATNHMVYSLKSLINFIPAPSDSNQVYLPNGQTTKVQHIGTVKIF